MTAKVFFPILLDLCMSYTREQCAEHSQVSSKKKTRFSKKNANRKMDGNYEDILIADLYDAIYIYRLKQNHGAATTKFRMKKSTHGIFTTIIKKTKNFSVVLLRNLTK